jgi:hypothetical protein
MPQQPDNPLDGRGQPLPAFSAGDADARQAEMGAALHEVGAQRRLVEVLADALTSCIVRLEDLNEGDGPTAQHARQALRRAGR